MAKDEEVEWRRMRRLNTYKVYIITKITNKRNRELAKRMPRILILVSIDIYGPLPLSRLGYEYFLEVINNYSRRV